MAFIYALMWGHLVLYVGKTINMKERERGHRSGKDSSGSRDIPNEYDWIMVLLEECEDALWTTREKYWYDTLHPLYTKCRPGTTAKEWIALKKPPINL